VVRLIDALARQCVRLQKAAGGHPATSDQPSPVRITCRWAWKGEPLAAGTHLTHISRGGGLHDNSGQTAEAVEAKQLAEGAAARAWALLQDLLRLHDSAATNFALRTAAAAAVLEEDSRVELPVWLVDGFIGDSSASVPTAAETAKGRSDGHRGEKPPSRTGHPTALISLFMQHGLLEQACDFTVRLLLLGGDLSQEHEHKLFDMATLDSTYFDDQLSWMPYSHIDRLLHLIERKIKQRAKELQGAEDAELSNLADKRQHLENALQMHFEHLITNYAQTTRAAM